MHELFSWFQQLTDFIFLLVPRRIIVRKTDRLVKFKWNGSVVEKGPGLRWYLPFTTEVIEVTTVRQPLDTSVIRFTTKDGVSCAIDCSITYYIDDIITFSTENYDGNLALSELVNSVICKKMRSMTFEEIQISSSINEELTELVSIDSEFLGIEIEYVRINQFVRILPISLINNDKPN